MRTAARRELCITSVPAAEVNGPLPRGLRSARLVENRHVYIDPPVRTEVPKREVGNVFVIWSSVHPFGALILLVG